MNETDLGNEMITSIAFHPKLLLMATRHSKDETGTVKLWEFAIDESTMICVNTLDIDDYTIGDITFCPMYPLLAIVSKSLLILWNYLKNSTKIIPDGGPTRVYNWYVNSVTFNPLFPIFAIGCFSYNSNFIANANVKLWRIDQNADPEQKEFRILNKDKYYKDNIKFHPTNQYILAICSNSGYKKIVTLLRITQNGNDAEHLFSFDVNTQISINSISFCQFAPIMGITIPGGVILYKFSPDYSRIVSFKKVDNSQCNSFSFHPSAYIFAMGLNDEDDEDDDVILCKFSPETLQVEDRTTLPRTQNSHNMNKIVAFCPISNLLATSEKDEKVKLWRINININGKIGFTDNLSLASRRRTQFQPNSSIHNSLQENWGSEIVIEKRLIEPKTNPVNQSCPNFTDLYKKIMKKKLPAEFRFKFEEQKGVDYGGLTRDVFNDLLPVYTSRFFISIGKNYDFVILKKKEDIHQPSPENLFVFETEQMKALAKAAQSKIFLRINPRLLKLLQSKSLKEYFNNSKKNSENSENLKNLYNFINLTTSQKNNNTNNKTFLVNNGNSKTIIKRFKEAQNNPELAKSLKKEIRLRKFAIDCGFETWEQLNDMYFFIQQFWNPETFTAKLKFDIESFVNRLLIKQIKLVGYQENNSGNKIPKYEPISISLEIFGKLSKDRKEFVFNQSAIDLFTEYSLLEPFLHFILGLDDENRKIFIRSITGSEYYPGELIIMLGQSTATEMKKLFHVGTCSNTLNLFKSSKNKNNNRSLKNIINSLKFQLEQNKEFSLL